MTFTLCCCYTDSRISGCDIRCRSTFRPNPEAEPDSKTVRISGQPEPNLRYLTKCMRYSEYINAADVLTDDMTLTDCWSCCRTSASEHCTPGSMLRQFMVTTAVRCSVVRWRHSVKISEIDQLLISTSTDWLIDWLIDWLLLATTASTITDAVTAQNHSLSALVSSAA